VAPSAQFASQSPHQPPRKTSFQQGPPSNPQPSGRGNHRGRGRGGRGWNNNSRVQCQLCGKMGHTVQLCFYRFDSFFSGSSPASSRQAGPDGGYNNNNSSAFSTNISTSNDSTDNSSWFPDSGATNYVTNDLSNLNLGSEYNGGSKLLVGNGAGLRISHVGSSIVS
jgi:hypothetical protein